MSDSLLSLLEDMGEAAPRAIIGGSEEVGGESHEVIYQREQQQIHTLGFIEYQLYLSHDVPYNLLNSNRYLNTLDNIKGKAGGHNEALLKQGILSLDSDIVITYSWGYEPHGVCGHVFEAYELYRTLRDLDPLNKQKITLLYADGTPPEKILKAIFNKYKGSKNELEELERDILFVSRPKCIKLRSTPLPYIQGYIPSNIVFCDGHVPGGSSGEYLFKADIIHLQLCAKNSGKYRDVEFNEDIFNTHIDNIGYYLLYADERLRMKPFTNDRAWLYDSIKTMRLDLLNPYKRKSPSHSYLVYMTPHDRSLTKETGLDDNQNIILDEEQSDELVKGIWDILHEIPKTLKESELLICGPQRKRFKLTKDQSVTASCDIEEIVQVILMKHQIDKPKEWANLSVRIVYEDQLPLKDIFSLFDTYIYTPTPKSWDCSSRFIPECKFYKKAIKLTKFAEHQLYSSNDENVDDPKTDYGLRVRLFDTFSNSKVKENKNNPKSKLLLNLTHQWQDEAHLPNFEDEIIREKFLQEDKIHLNKLEMFDMLRYRNLLYPNNIRVRKNTI